MDQSMVELNHKIDALTTQVQFLTDQAQIAERQRADRAELMRDLTPIANEAFRLSVEQLEEIQEYVELDDLLRLVKRLARNGRNFEKMLNQLESVMDLAETMGPLANEAFGKAVQGILYLRPGRDADHGQRGHLIQRGRCKPLWRQRGADPEYGQGNDPARNHEFCTQHAPGG